MFKKTRESVSSGFASLKVCKTNNDNCKKEKNEGFTNIKILQDKLKTLGVKVRIKYINDNISKIIFIHENHCSVRQSD